MEKNSVKSVIGFNYVVMNSTSLHILDFSSICKPSTVFLVYNNPPKTILVVSKSLPIGRNLEHEVLLCLMRLHLIRSLDFVLTNKSAVSKKSTNEKVYFALPVL